MMVTKCMKKYRKKQTHLLAKRKAQPTVTEMIYFMSRFKNS